jgi:hypothetical protein
VEFHDYDFSTLGHARDQQYHQGCYSKIFQTVRHPKGWHAIYVYQKEKVQGHHAFFLQEEGGRHSYFFLDERDDVLGCHKMKIEFKAGEQSPLFEGGGETTHICFYPLDQSLQEQSAVSCIPWVGANQGE